MLVIGSDHGGFSLKESLKSFLRSHQEVADLIDVGTDSEASVDYPDIAKQVVQSILDGQATSGILICGTGIGISMAANRYSGIRAALVYDAFSAEMAKAHNNANVLCLGGRTTSIEDAKSWVDIWLNTPFEGGRHQRRIEKLDDVT